MCGQRFIEYDGRSERGVALVTTMLIMMLMAALMIGFSAVVMSDQRYRFIDRDRAKSFYAAQSGLEKLNADLANLFFVHVAPTTADLAALAAQPPAIPGVTFRTDGAGVAYGVTSAPLPPGTSAAGPIKTGPYEGLIALKKAYDLHASVRTTGGGETYLKRRVETVAIPVFQFGIFSDVDLSFSAADEFDFGGRVHTNGNLFLAHGGTAGSTLWLRDRVTAVKEIVRERLSNGVGIDTSGSTRTIQMATSSGTYRPLARTEGSLMDGVGSPVNTAWPNLSLSTYNGYIRNGKTGAKPLNLPMITTGGANADLVRRATPNEDTANPTLLGERYYSKVSLRILLSDTAADIMSLPTVTSTPPVRLDGNWVAAPPAGYTVDASHPPVARSPGEVNANVTANVAATALGATANVPVNVVPAYFRIPVLRVNKGPNTYTVTCTGKTATTFTGCGMPNPVPAAPVTAAAPAATVSAVLNTVDGNVPVSTTLTATWATGWGTITVADTTAFAPRSFWVQNGNGTDVLVTCTGYDTTPRFTGCTVPAALQNAALVRNSALSSAGTGTIGGFIKIELQDTNNVWHDVTMQILNFGIAGPNLDGKPCGDPTPNAILRLQRLRDNSEPGAGVCSYAFSQRSTDYWPNTLFDTREATFRDINPGSLRLGGVMHHVTLDVRNVSQWFAGSGVYAGSPGPTAVTDNGYSVYFSDRRNNRTQANQETGEYGFEDFVNPGSGTGTPNNTLDVGEDVNGSNTQQLYGQFPNYNGIANTVPPGAAAPLDINARPLTVIRPSQAKVNRAVLFRRALKLINGSLGNIVAPGFTVASENPVYVQGDWNANQAGFIDPHVATSVAADAVTLLSNSWDDNNSFDSPYVTAGRPRSGHTYYRLAIIAGKGRIFPQPPGSGATFGTDGGAHSFLRFLEGRGGADTIHYRGSLASFFYNRQAVSPFKCCGGVVYDVPVRDYTFDIDFLDPAKLPPLTPVFRDVNSLGFTQEIRPSQ